MLKPIVTATLLALAIAPPAVAQQSVDPSFEPRIAAPSWPSGTGPVVAIDAGHNNFHTADGQYAPFARLLAADGYQVRASPGALDAAALAGVKLLVISNARGRPAAAPAFTPAEADAIDAWVKAGGSLLLIADHAPFGSAAEALGKRFGVDMGKGYAVIGPPLVPRLSSQIEFTGSLLGTHPILSGRNRGEAVRKVRSFTGQSLGVPAGATALLVLPKGALEVAGTAEVDALAAGRTVPGTQVGGRAQGVALEHGKGRVVVLGEAAMLSAQIIRRPGQPEQRIGLDSDRNDNQRFALNLMRWLARAP